MIIYWNITTVLYSHFFVALSVLVSVFLHYASFHRALGAIIRRLRYLCLLTLFLAYRPPRLQNAHGGINTLYYRTFNQDGRNLTSKYIILFSMLWSSCAVQHEIALNLRSRARTFVQLCIVFPQQFHYVSNSVISYLYFLGLNCLY